MYSEIGFIFNPALKNYNNIDNTGNIYQRPIQIKPSNPDPNTSQGQSTPTSPGSSQNPVPGAPAQAVDTGVLVYKDPKASGTVGIINYLKDSIYKYDDTNEDPYISLIKYFEKSKALNLRAADFAYLKDLGVYPVNRLWVLRRFPDNCIVPNNLSVWGDNGVRPVSTVVGWIKDKEDSSFLSLTFNEVWVDQSQMLDQVFKTLLNDEFGFQLDATASVPGWSQGILFGMLKAMGLSSDYNAQNVPTGDPNVLRVGKMRDVNNQGIASKMNVTLETTYEQKYINGVDPGMAMLDILSNLFKMGTSDQRFMLNANAGKLRDLIGNINGKQSVDAWISLIKGIVVAFTEGVDDFIKEMAGLTGESEDGGTNTEPPDGLLSGLSNIIGNVTDAILTGTISKYRWPLKGSIGLMSGLNTTPWHLTIGNPYSPIINIGNIYVNNVDVKLSNDLGFNDMPIRIDVSITPEFGRPLGKQELEKMFNNGYKRVYSKQLPNNVESEAVKSNIPATELPATAHVIGDDGQPIETRTLIDKSVYVPER